MTQIITVKFISLDSETRTATFDVDGEQVVRQIADGVTTETLEDHLFALAQGLITEYKERQQPVIQDAPFQSCDVIVEEQPGI